MAALVDYGSSGSEDEEPISEPSSTSRDQKSLISVLSKQGGGSKDSSKRKGGVRIGLPSLDPKDDSDDEDTSKPSEKKSKVTQGEQPGGSGLTALLPQPKSVASLGQSSSSRERASFGQNVKRAPLVPHAVRKRQQLKQTKPTKKTDGSSSEEEDGGDVPFFSHLQASSTGVPSDSLPEESEADWNSHSLASTMFPSTTPVTSLPTGTSSSSSGGSMGMNTEDGYNSGAYQGEYGVAGQYYAQQYQQCQAQYGDDPSSLPVGGISNDYPSSDDMQLNQQSLKRLMGGKNWKQKQKEIQFTDLNEKDITQGGQHMRMVHSKEEMEAMVAQAEFAKEVSGMAKRKHQITFLVSQAKSRELQLKNQWAQNRQTKKQTQMKYGF